MQRFLASILGVIICAAAMAAYAQQSNTASVRENGNPYWPSFRGMYAYGVADGQNLPELWDGEKDVNIKWKTRIPGLAH